MTEYPVETLDEDTDDGTMPDNVNDLREAVVGHKIVSVTKEKVVEKLQPIQSNEEGLVIRLDNGTQVQLVDTDDCCAYTELKEFFLDMDKIDHVIMGVGTTEGYSKWHIYADLGDILELTVGWSSGNPFYYGYGFDIAVKPLTLQGGVIDKEIEA